jgi:hypothetical protein
MNGDHSVRQLIEELSSAALRDVLRNVRHHTELRRRIASGMVDERWVNQAYRDYARREGASYRQQAADLTLQYYSDLTDLGNQYSERFYSEVLDGQMAFERGNGHRRNGEAETAGSTEAVEAIDDVAVELHGPLGREVVARFGLENTEDHAVTLALDVGSCRGPGDEPFLAPLTVQPAEVTLQPGDTRQVTLRLLMLPSVFVPGHLYRLPITARGSATDLRLSLTIWAEEPTSIVPVDSSPPDAPVEPPGKPSATESERFIVRCPACKREFERRQRSTRLYRHNTPEGDPCPERTGRVRVAR